VEAAVECVLQRLGGGLVIADVDECLSVFEMAVGGEFEAIEEGCGIGELLGVFQCLGCMQEGFLEVALERAAGGDRDMEFGDGIRAESFQPMFLELLVHLERLFEVVTGLGGITLAHRGMAEVRQHGGRHEVSVGRIFGVIQSAAHGEPVLAVCQQRVVFSELSGQAAEVSVAAHDMFMSCRKLRDGIDFPVEREQFPEALIGFRVVSLLSEFLYPRRQLVMLLEQLLVYRGLR